MWGENVYSGCFCCGPENTSGLRIKSFWNGEEGVCRWRAQPKHIGIDGLLNGGIIAALIDCHSFWTGLASLYQSEGRKLGEGKPEKIFTGSINIRYLHPIPIDAEVELKAQLTKTGNRSRVVTCSVKAGKKECARGEVTLVLAD